MTTMLRRTGPLAARVLWLATVGFAGLGLFGWAQLGFRALPVSLGSGANIVLATAVVGLTYATVGILIVDRRPDNTIGWLFLAIGFGVSAILPVDVLVASAHVVLRPVPETTLLLAWWTSTSTLPIASTLVIAIVILFPTGRPIGRRWWSVIALAALGSFFVWIAAAIRPSGLIWFPSLGNPFAVPELASVLGMLTMVGVVLEIGVLALAMASVVLRFRRADPALRAQMKWAGGAIVLAAVSGVPVILLRYTAVQWLGSAEAFLTLAIVGQGLVPVAVGIAVLHYHLYDIELLLDRSLVYLPLLGLLGGLYAGSVALSQRAFVALTGDTSDVAIIVSSLLIAWVFTPLRKILEGLVERHIRAAKPTTAQVHPDRQAEVAALEQEVQSLEWRLERLEAAAAFGA